MKEFEFPEFIFNGMDKNSVEFMRRNWSADPEQFVSNCSKELGIEVEEYNCETGDISYRKLSKEKARD